MKFLACGKKMDCFKQNKGHLSRNIFSSLQLKDAYGKHRKYLPNMEAEEFIEWFT